MTGPSADETVNIVNMTAEQHREQFGLGVSATGECHVVEYLRRRGAPRRSRPVGPGIPRQGATTPTGASTSRPDEYPPDEYPPDEYPLGEYRPGEYRPDEYPLGESRPDEYPPDEYPPDEYPPDEYPPDEYPPDEYPPDEYPPDEYPPDEYPPDEYPPDEYPPDGRRSPGFVPSPVGCDRPPDRFRSWRSPHRSPGTHHRARHLGRRSDPADETARPTRAGHHRPSATATPQQHHDSPACSTHKQSTPPNHPIHTPTSTPRPRDRSHVGR